MKPALIILISLFTCYDLRGQKKLPSFGEIDIVDLKMTSCSFEPDAPAVKLFDVTETDFNLFSDGSSKMKIEHRIRIKIFNEKGYEYANVRIPYISKRGIGRIKELKGIVYTPDASGKIIREELEKNDFYKQKIVENLGMVSFTFPKLKPGCVVEYSYTRIENNIYQINPWIIQSEIPVQYSSYSIKTPPFALLREKLFGHDSVEFKNKISNYYSPGKKIFFKENISSFKPEPFMTSDKDNLLKMIFFHIPQPSFYAELLSSSQRIWREVGDYFLRSEKINGQIKKPIPGSEKIIDSANMISSVPDRIKYIYASVIKQIPGKTQQTINPEDIIEAWNSHTGNTADINIVLLNLLEKAKITCYPLLVSTRDNGIISKEFPTFSQLNGLDVVAMIDSSKYFILDASLRFQSVNTPPLNILNREALLLRSGHINWFMVNDERSLLKQSIAIFGNVKESGIVEGEASLQHYHYAKSHRLDSSLSDEEEKNNKFFDKKPQGLKIISTKQEITEDDDDPLFESILFTYQPQQTDNYYFFNPQFLTPQQNNPFKSDKRVTDIDLLCNQEIIISVNLALPASFEVDHLPKNIIVRAPDSSFYYKRSYSVSSGIIHLTQIFEISRAMFLKEDYTGIKEFFNRMHNLMNEEVVLKKKN
jgi:hypothetical protein